jgi:DNA-binding LacI/PurR family transcriptional regulator
MGQLGANLLLNSFTSGKRGQQKEIRVPEYLVVRSSTAPPKEN